MALDFFAGCLGGCAGVLVGHPLDTVKVILQAQSAQNPKYSGTYDCLRSLLIREGIRGVYKGVTSPLCSVAFINAVVFGVYGSTQRCLSNPESLKSHFYAGAIAGFCQSVIASPMELIKSRMQVSSDPNIKGPWEYVKKIYKIEGARGLFRGYGLTTMREIPSFACYFWAFEYLTRREGPVSTLTMMGAGGLAGVLSWVVVYPIDVIKTRMQVDNGKYLNTLDCLRNGLATEGYGFLFRGLTPTIIRAFPVNAATFTVVTWTMRICENDLFGGEEFLKKFDKALGLNVSEIEPI